MMVWLPLGLVLGLVLLARVEWLRLSRRKRFAADGRLIVVAVVVTIVGRIAALLAALLVIGLTLAKLLLCRCDQPEIMFRVLIIVFGCDRVSGTLRVAGKLKIFLADMRRGSPDFHVRSVGFVHARQRILVMTALAVATAHSLILTVSHDLLFRQPLVCDGVQCHRLTV